MDYKSLINLGYSNIQICYLRAPIVDSITLLTYLHFSVIKWAPSDGVHSNFVMKEPH